MKDHWFWLSLTIGSVAWYSIVTVYVAIKGFSDIKQMLRRLKEDNSRQD